MFSAVTASSSDGSSLRINALQKPLEAISLNIARMAESNMKNAIIAALKIGDYNGDGFVPCAELGTQPMYADMKDHQTFVYRQGPHPVPLHECSEKKETLFADIVSDSISDKNPVEVSIYRVALPHLGDLQTLRALVGMGPSAIDIFSTQAVRSLRVVELILLLLFCPSYELYSPFMCR
jgi:hypothetical protein